MEISIEYPESNRKFLIKVVGVTADNPNGVNRQALLNKQKSGEEVILKREPDNQYDKWAIAVFSVNGEQFGYLPKNDERLASELDGGCRIKAKIHRIIGGPTFFERILKKSGKSYGCVLEIEKGDPDWKIVSPLLDEDRETNKLLKHTRELKRKSLIEENYKTVIQRIIEFDSKGLQAKAWRRTRIPVKEFSQFLEKEGMIEEALGLIDWYSSYDDYFGVSASDLKSIESRKEKLLKKMKTPHNPKN